MIENIKLLIGEGAREARALLSHYPHPVENQNLRVQPDMKLPDTGCVLVLSLPEARQLLNAAPAQAYVLVLWFRTSEHADPDMLQHAAIAGILRADSQPETVYTVLQSAFRLLVVRHSEDAARMLENVLDIGRALASEKDSDKLLSLILTQARALTGADGSSIYTRDRDGELYFRLWQNASTTMTANAQKTAVGRDSVAGYVARSGETVLLDDAYAIPATAPYKFNPVSDNAIRYRTKSLLTLPLTNKGGEVVGVLQLINRKGRSDILLRTADDVAAYVQPFDARSKQLAQALAGQAGVAIENSMLYNDIEHLFEGFIKASVQAIEARDPSTAGHSFRVANFTERLAEAVDRCDLPGLRDLRFSRAQLREIRYAALLHDFGKVGVREDVLVKAKKLHPQQLEILKQRFRYARLSVAHAAHRKLLDLIASGDHDPTTLKTRQRELEQTVSEEQARLERHLFTVLRANEPSVMHASVPMELREVLAYSFPDGETLLPLLHDFEFDDLTLPKGSLTAQERVEIESHVTHTFEFLSLIPWTRDLARLPEYAYAHHEKLDGSGYPRGLSQAEIPIPARMMTISDIYDALTAPDRPYKLAVSSERALDILGAEARANKIDATLLQVFIESEAYR